MSNSSQLTSPASPATSPAETRGRSSSRGESDFLSKSQSEKLRAKKSISPLARPDNLIVDISGKDSPQADKESPSALVSRTVLGKCPCRKSTGGQSWLLKCTSCTQHWHNGCANLKGNLPKSTVDSIDLWQCPWCYTCPIVAPKSHKSQKTAAALQYTALSDTLLSQIEETVKTAISNCDIPNFVGIESQLNKLTVAVESFSRVRPADTPFPDPQELAEEEPVESIPHTPSPNELIDCQPYSDYKENYISEELAEEIKTFLDSEQFKSEGKREVISYGEKYKYMGSRSLDPKPIPDILKPLLDSLNEGLGYTMNQILVNRYTGKDACLPSHSDDEKDINPSSSIFTVSIGDQTNVSFCSTVDDEKKDLTVTHRSLYAMTRDSQNVFRHEILPNPSNRVRYSLTFRHVHWTHLNSTYAVGDSNFGKIKFGEGKGCVGKSTPGMRDFYPKVESINPHKCMSHSNIVVMCGTNNLKERDVDVLTTYKIYKGKFEEIRRLNSKGNLFVCPVLPSRNADINKNIIQFNRLIFDDLVKSNLNINVVHGFGGFVDSGGLLRSALHDRRTSEDVLHINAAGYRILVGCIKRTIFNVKNMKNRPSTGRLFSTAVQGTPLNPT